MTTRQPPVDRVHLTAGLDVSRIITGLWQIADMERGGRRIDLDATADAMAPYVEAGLTTFDMADHYGSAEDIAGRFRRRHPGLRAEFLTKWVPKPGKVSEPEVRAAVERARDRMGGDRIALLQFHPWNYADPGWIETLLMLSELREEGLIGELGLTNVDTAHLRIAVRTGLPIVSNQVSFSLLDRRAAAAMATFSRPARVSLLAFGILAGGLMTERWLGRDDPTLKGLTTWSQMKYRRFIDAAGGWDAFQRLLVVVARIAARHGAPMATIATRYALDQPAAAAIIVGARLGASEHIGATLQSLTLAMNPESRVELDDAIRALTPIPGDCGDEYRKPPYLTASGDLSHHFEALEPPFEVRLDAHGRARAFSGTVWEGLAGFSRAVRQGDQIHVSGTTATLGDRAIGGTDAEAQTDFAIDKIEGALQSLGGALADVVRTRIYVRDLSDWEAVARAHGRRLGEIQPANTLVRAELVGQEYLVEIEADAVIGQSARPGPA